MRTGMKLALILFVLPILLGGVVLLVAGRPIAFEVLQWRTASRFPQVKWVKTEELAQWLNTPTQRQPVILDARTEIEFDVSRLKGAVRIDPYRPSLRPLRGLSQNAPLLVYSSAGYRGARVASWLERMGYPNVHNLAGGIFAWANEGRPVFRGETPTAQVHPFNRVWGHLVDGDYRAQAPDLEKRSAAP